MEARACTRFPGPGRTRDNAVQPQAGNSYTGCTLHCKIGHACPPTCVHCAQETMPVALPQKNLAVHQHNTRGTRQRPLGSTRGSERTGSREAVTVVPRPWAMQASQVVAPPSMQTSATITLSHYFAVL